VLSPAHLEATTPLAADPTLTGASPTLHYSILSAMANGSVTTGAIGNRLRRPVPSLGPALHRLIASELVLRHEDPIRARRPSYALADPFLQFHYAVLEPHGMLLREGDPPDVWKGSRSSTFHARVRGPVFEEQARSWVRRYARAATVGAPLGHVGPSSVSIGGREHEIDLLVAVGDEAAEPSERIVTALGDAKAGETITHRHARHLERSRASLGTRAAGAKFLFFGAGFD
jgi:uncharacterized protein